MWAGENEGKQVRRQYYKEWINERMLFLGLFNRMIVNTNPSPTLSLFQTWIDRRRLFICEGVCGRWLIAVALKLDFGNLHPRQDFHHMELDLWKKHHNILSVSQWKSFHETTTIRGDYNSPQNLTIFHLPQFLHSIKLLGWVQKYRMIKINSL